MLALRLHVCSNCLAIKLLKISDHLWNSFPRIELQETRGEVAWLLVIARGGEEVIETSFLMTSSLSLVHAAQGRERVWLVWSGERMHTIACSEPSSDPSSFPLRSEPI